MSEAFEAAFARLPQAQRTQRSAAWQAFRETGLPRKHAEEWRHTDLSTLAQASFMPASLVHPDLPKLEGAELLAFVNGYVTDGSLALVTPMESAPLRCGISALNAALSSDGLNLRVPAGKTRGPLYLLTWFGGADQGMAHIRHRVVLEANARAVIVWHELICHPEATSCHPEATSCHPEAADVIPRPQAEGSTKEIPRSARDDRAARDDKSFFATQLLDIELGANAQLELYRVQQPGPGARYITRVDARIARDARLTSVSLHAGSALSRHDVNLSLDGPGAQAELHGLLAPAAGTHLDVHTRIDHVAPHGRSRENFRAIVPAGAKASFNGKVVVHRHAQKTDSEQHIDSLLLAPGAEINAKPELQIDAGDVKCAHGATAGQLDEDALYYLRARGLSLEVARGALVQAFAEHIVVIPRSEATRDLFNRSLATLGMTNPLGMT